MSRAKYGKTQMFQSHWIFMNEAEIHSNPNAFFPILLKRIAAMQ